MAKKTAKKAIRISFDYGGVSYWFDWHFVTVARLRSIKNYYPEFGSYLALQRGFGDFDPEAVLAVVWVALDESHERDGTPRPPSPNELANFSMADFLESFKVEEVAVPDVGEAGPGPTRARTSRSASTQTNSGAGISD